MTTAAAAAASASASASASIPDDTVCEAARAMAERIGVRDAALIRTKCLIGGEWVGAASSDTDASTIPVTNPATGEMLVRVPNLGATATRAAVAAAEAAFPAWSRTSAASRSALLRRWNDLILEHADDLARIMVAEQGKPMVEAKGEVGYAASFVDWFAEEARRTYGEVIPSHNPDDSRLFALRQPVGVTAAITPWNFPLAMITRKAAAALAAGCVMVIKPSELTPLSALALGTLATRAGIPSGVLGIITGDAAEIGDVLTSHPIVRKLSFTGSTAVGKLLMRQCAGTVKRVSMELGGNAPFIVFEDADVDAAVDGAMASKFRNSGQTCVCAQRFLVHASVADEFATKLADRASKLVVGPGLGGKGKGDGVVVVTDQGPLINAAAVAKVEAHVADAVSKGARVLTGGARVFPPGTTTATATATPGDSGSGSGSSGGGTFYAPTVLTKCSADMRVFREETFGPVAPIATFETEAEAIAAANDTPAGLASYVYTRDVGRLWRVGESLRFGIVGANTGLISTAGAPFGGVKESGVGREGGKHGMDEYLDIKYVCMAGLGT